ncbi:AAA family ATPase [Sphingorhabdus sp.]|jgi:sugar phosphate isomerase/epimerase|uniref:AAA family ATPase n=1 Tax=Sphingorhabdus sp. TaxID=1902408 RepID=UPI0035B4E26C
MESNSTIAPKIWSVKVPKELRKIAAWLIWRFEQFEGETKPRKIPYWFDGTRRHGQQGGPIDRERLTVFGVAREAAVRLGYDGVGFAPLDGLGYTFLDFDNCVGPNGSLPPEIEEIASRTYAEYSPSGNGVRIALKGNLGNRKSISTPDQYGFETFSTSGYVTFTGNILDICDLTVGPNYIAEVDDHVRKLCEKRFGSAQPQAHVDPDDFMIGHEPRLGLSVERMEELLAALDPDMGRDPWIRVGMGLHHECEGDDTGFEIWDEWSSGGATYPGTEGLRVQWDSFERRKRQPRKNVTMATVINMAKEADYRAPGLTANELRNVVEEEAGKWPHSEGVRTPEGFTGKFPVHAAGDPILHQSLEWYIKGVIPKSDLIVLFGASGSGKSFIALDIVAAIARGVAWQGHRVTKAKAVIIAAEGAGAAGKRISAYCKRHNINEAELDLGIITVPPDVLKDFDIAELAKALKTAGADIFVIDTFAQVTPGANENSSEDMGLALSNIRKITAATGATALVVHHAGKDAGRGARGWSGIRAAADAELEVSYNDNGRLLKITKMKDGEDSLAWGFRLNVIDLSVDIDGDPETSCVVEYMPAPLQRQKADQPKGARQRDIMDNARKCGAATLQGALTKEVIDACVKLIAFEHQPAEGSKPRRDQRRDSVKRALDRLCEQGFLKAHNDRLYLPGVGPD